MKVLPLNEAAIAQAAEAIRAGEVVAYPTETVYGLAVDPFSSAALQRLYEIKQRDLGAAILLIAADEAQARTLIAEVSEAAAHCMRAFWPGPLSLLFPPAPALPAQLLGPTGKICVRCPGDANARALCAAAGSPVTSTSANLSGQPPARSAEEVRLTGVAIVLDGGRLADTSPSTVYDPETGQVLRKGPISREELIRACGSA